MTWERAASLEELEHGPVLHTSPPRQIALFRVGGRVHAVDNRCPHEGYPLVEGTVGADGLLTCLWHNWKFRLEDGACVLGGDDVRAYPVAVRDGAAWVDVTDPPPEQTEARVIRGLRAAFEERDGARIAREIARLAAHGLDPLSAVRRAVEWSHDRLEYGATHAYAAAADWLALHDECAGREDARLVCLAEAVDHMAADALRHPRFPYPTGGEPFDGAAFARAIEDERADAAGGMVVRAVADGLGWDALEPAFAAAALAHYNDFGHSAIYVHKTGELVGRLGEEATRWLAPALARHLAYTTREDLQPEFRGYADALSAMRDVLVAAGSDGSDGADGGNGVVGGVGGDGGDGGDAGDAGDAAGGARPDAGELFGANVGRCLRWTVDRAGRGGAALAVGVLHDALLEAGARHLLHYDARYQGDSHRPVSQNVGWLDFTHAVTFGNAVRALCARHPALWPAGLLQMACFVGRNASFLDRDVDAAAWRVDDERRFLDAVRERLLDHGLREPIVACHLLKTARAVQAEIDVASPACRAALLAALNRFLHAPLKQKHALRNARQALALVRRDFA
jgi:nitrite reductase/ring-hydroxylating ferredoxin subunit